jgi:uncharacterized iron-regulated protein
MPSWRKTPWSCTEPASLAKLASLRVLTSLFASFVFFALLAGCAAPGPQWPSSTPSPTPEDIASQVQALLPAHAILLGEQHDAPDHQRIHLAVVTALAQHGALAAVALEMADQGDSTAALPSHATEDGVRGALHWNEKAWGWSVYGPAVMAAVRAGVPVLGANLPRSKMREAMGDAGLDTLLDGPALKAQQQLIRSGHCNLLPESQIAPMTRIQIARDVAMAQTMAGVLKGELVGSNAKTVVLLAGSGHVDRLLGVPQHLAASQPGIISKSVRLGATQDDSKAGQAIGSGTRFDAAWPAAAAPFKDYCADLKSSLPAR